MDPPHVHKMVSFGHCEKVDIGDGQAPIGHYGNGFKSGSMRIGKDAVVFTSDGKSKTVALLSQSYLAAIKAQEVLVPMASWSLDGKPIIANTEVNLAAILKHSPFTTKEQIDDRFNMIDKRGTLIVIFNLRKLEDALELDLHSNQTGAQLQQEDTPTKGKKGPADGGTPLEEYSLHTSRFFTCNRVCKYLSEGTEFIPGDYEILCGKEKILFTSPKALPETINKFTSLSDLILETSNISNSICLA